MKRFQVMDLFHGDETEEDEGPWKDVKHENPKMTSKGIKVKVKLTDNSEEFAYYFSDCSPLLNGFKWWGCHSHDPLTNVTHFKYLKKDAY